MVALQRYTAPLERGSMHIHTIAAALQLGALGAPVASAASPSTAAMSHRDSIVRHTTLHIDRHTLPMTLEPAPGGAYRGVLAGDPAAHITIVRHTPGDGSGEIVIGSLVSPTVGAMRLHGQADGSLVAVPAAMPDVPLCAIGHPEEDLAEPCVHERARQHRIAKLAPLQSVSQRGLEPDCVEDGSRIDLLVVYSNEALALLGSVGAVEAEVMLGVAELNSALAVSNPTPATVQVNVVGIEHIAEDAGAFSSTALSRITETNDGFFDDAHVLRDALDADLVCLITGGLDVCGRAWLLGPGPTPAPELGFSVVAAPCITGPTYALAHEIGHNLGARHHFEDNDCTNGAFEYAKGYVDPGGAFHTIMASGANLAGPRIPQFSNPDVDFMGQPTGSTYFLPGGADNARVFRSVRTTVARYRSRDVNLNGVCDDVDLATNPAFFDANGNGEFDSLEPDFNNNGIPDVTDFANGTSTDLDGDTIPDELEQPVIYVDASATGDGTGTSWANARTDLADTLLLHGLSGDIQQVWVAAGTYKPAPAPQRIRPFEPLGSIELYGSFAGTETDPAQRNIAANPTILCGDLNSDDGPGFINRADNALTVLEIDRMPGESVVVDGFTIRGGRSFAAPNCGFNGDGEGGGIFALFVDEVTIRNCTFADNIARSGGGAYIANGIDLDLSDTNFVANRAIPAGLDPTGGEASALLFQNNTEDVWRVTNTRFLGNDAPDGSGAVALVGTGSVFTNCVWSGNTAFWITSAVASTGAAGSDNTFINCTFTGNHVESSGSAIGHARSQTVYTNCLIWGNTRGESFTADYRAQVSDVTPTAGEVPPQFDHCIVQGWTGFYVGANNDGIDPMLTDPDGPDDVLGTIDDAPVPGGGSHANDRGLSSAVPAGITTDLLGNPRFADDPAAADLGTAPVVDIGAYEFATLACSAADVTTDGTANGSPDGAVTLSDFSFYLALWGTSAAAADLTTDGTANGIPDGSVTLSDFSFYLALWGAGCP